MRSLTAFQIVIIAICLLGIVGGVVAFATYRSGSSADDLPPMTLWGSVPREQMESFLANSQALRDTKVQLSYVEKRAESLEAELVDALASGRGPDLILAPQELILRQQGKLAVLPYGNLSERDFKNSFIGGGEIFLLPEGVLAQPVLVDPLVLYWNRTLLTNAGVANPPRFWDELFTLAPLVSERDKQGNITRSLVAFGEYGNVSGAKAILSALILQGGNAIVGKDSSGRFTALLGLTTPDDLSPVESAVRFYTDFSNPSKSIYSWNRGLPQSQEMFAAGKLGLYVGFASELPAIRAKNPNLDFDLAALPQVRDGARVATYGRLYAFAVPRASANQGYALLGAMRLTQAAPAQEFANALGIPPARRDLLAATPADPYLVVLYRAALQSLSWLDLDAVGSDAVFRRMIESVTSGRARIGESVNRANAELQEVLNRFNAF
ncbi:MAG TPA: extracellular solute-binding protein [Candidatus Paceibacterota bacterium]|nr:extracellular solute-binding protein [Candidatus Paceibacterota bacterium]